MQAEMASKGNWPYENAIDWSKVREEKGPNRQKNNPPLFAIVPAWEGAHLRHWSQKSYLAISPLLTHSHLAYNEVLWWFLKLILRLNKLLIGKLKKRRGGWARSRESGLFKGLCGQFWKTTKGNKRHLSPWTRGSPLWKGRWAQQNGVPSARRTQRDLS